MLPNAININIISIVGDLDKVSNFGTLLKTLNREISRDRIKFKLIDSVPGENVKIDNHCQENSDLKTNCFAGSDRHVDSQAKKKAVLHGRREQPYIV